jgi:putative Mg2+ transporter-C (MgtC) family protein
MEVFRELSNYAIVLRIALAVIIGGLIGLERESKNQPAGSRTYILVCLGACLVMMTNQYIYNYFQGGDPSRLGAQVVSGIGFLGAGTILVTRNNQIRGLTSAAGLWASACTGLAIGIGFYEGAIGTGVVLLFVLTILKRLDNIIKFNSKYIRLYINFVSTNTMNQFIKQCREGNMKILDIQFSKVQNNHEGGIPVLLTIKNAYKCQHSKIIEQFIQFDGIRHIEEI